jgi:uncharacterized protein
VTRQTLVVGASPHPHRYAHLAVQRLNSQGHPVIAFGRRAGAINDIPIVTRQEEVVVSDLDTLTLYLGPDHQAEYLDWFLALNPRRVIFNPGTENPEMESRLSSEGIEVIRACTLVMLSVGTY